MKLWGKRAVHSTAEQSSGRECSSIKLLRVGEIIVGRWEQRAYEVVRPLGRGGTGQVYLVKNADGEFRALKISTDLLGISHEHRILVLLNQKQYQEKIDTVPLVYELDDFQRGKTVYHYFVMEYCRGINLTGYLGRFSVGETAFIGAQISTFLACLHECGLVFGDLKPGNVLYDRPAAKVRIIDYGSVCARGQGLKQYTPGYDRATWKAGSRVADKHFDIFSLGILMTNMVLGKSSSLKSATLGCLVGRVESRVRSAALKMVIIGALNQKPRNCTEIARDLTAIVNQSNAPGQGHEYDTFVNIVGAASVVSFIMGVFYYVQ